MASTELFSMTGPELLIIFLGRARRHNTMETNKKKKEFFHVLLSPGLEK
jgi:hypothetical protein